MNLSKNIFKVSVLASLIFASSVKAELVSTDWKVQGDESATLDTNTGIEWLDLKITDGLSIAQVQDLLATDFEGWRLPTRNEVENLISTYIPSIGENTAFGQYSSQSIDSNAIVNMVELFGNTYLGELSRGMHLNDEMETKGGSLVLLSGVRYDKPAEGINYSWDRSDSIYTSYDADGVYLVSNGGTTLSSREDPSLNNPANAVQNVNTPASMTALFLFLFLTLRLFGRRA